MEVKENLLRATLLASGSLLDVVGITWLVHTSAQPCLNVHVVFSCIYLFLHISCFCKDISHPRLRLLQYDLSLDLQHS